MSLNRPRNIEIADFLDTLDARLLEDMECILGGGTAVALLNDEYRVTNDLNFVSCTREGYKKLHETIFGGDFDLLFKAGEAPKRLRDVASNQYGMKAAVELNGAPLALQFARETRFHGKIQDSQLPVPVLSKVSLFTDKLLANMDRHSDKAALSKDVFDLIIMTKNWGDIPDQAVVDAVKAYGEPVGRCFEIAVVALRSDSDYFRSCVKALDIDSAHELVLSDFIHIVGSEHLVNSKVDKL